MQEVQRAWAATSIHARLAVLQRARYLVAARAGSFAGLIAPELARTHADTLVAEVLPLLDACKFLERRGASILRTERLGRSGRPFWLRGVQAEIRREPLGHVVVIGPANFPLFLPGVQALQALAAGNAVLWKPGSGGAPVARLFADVLREAGLPASLLFVLDESLEAAQAALASHPGKVIFTGSSATGREVLSSLAATLTPAVVELSGADAVLVLDSADLPRVAKAVAFGLRLNGGAVCMSPRRLIGSPATLKALFPLLSQALEAVPPVHLEERSSRRLGQLLQQAEAQGAQVEGSFSPEAQRPLLVRSSTPEMEITRADLFAPVIALIEASSEMMFPSLYAQCPYALTASIFGDEKRALALAGMLRAGSVLVNDLIVPTADPRLPFGGRGESGYGLTRGAEGLLEMTTVKVVQVRRGSSTKHLEATTGADTALFTTLIRVMHAGSWGERLRALRELPAAARQRRSS